MPLMFAGAPVLEPAEGPEAAEELGGDGHRLLITSRPVTSTLVFRRPPSDPGARLAR